MTDDIGLVLLRRLRWLTWTTIALFVALVVVGTVGYIRTSNERDALRTQEADTTKALCALRKNAEDNVAASVAFLSRHPTGIAGISAADIQSGITRSQNTITALAYVQCVTVSP